MIYEHGEWLRRLFMSPERYAIMAAGGWAAYYNGLAATTVPVVAETAVVVGIAALPVVAMAGVFVALGSGYAAARVMVANENTASGFSQGFVTGLLSWEWHHVVDRFRMPFLRINRMDGATDAIRVNAYHGGLKAGWAAAAALDPAARKAYLSKMRKLGGVQGPKAWSTNRDVARNEQISYVIALAAAGRRYGIIEQR
jgi:hypothetical protein